MDDRERKPDNRNNKKRNYQLYIILAIVAAVTVALITGLDSLVKKSTTKKVTYDEFVENVKWYEIVNTDWFDILTRDTYSLDHTFGVSGGNDAIR